MATSTPRVRTSLGEDGVCVLTMTLPSATDYSQDADGGEARRKAHEEHRINSELIAELSAGLDRSLEHRDRRLAAGDEGFCVVLTNETPSVENLKPGDHPRSFFSAGLDTEKLGVDPAGGSFGPAFFAEVEGFMRLVRRFVTMPCPTIAAINGHAVAGGYILAMALDVRVMREGRAWLWFPEVIFGLGMGETFRELVTCRLPRDKVRDVLLFGSKVQAKQGAAFGLVDEAAATAADVLPAALKRASALRMLGSKRTGASIALARYELFGGAGIDASLADSRKPAEISEELEAALKEASAGRRKLGSAKL
jgi:enoyl-CoA hydratase/carnithine racemase